MNKFIENNKLWIELIAVLSIGVLPDLYRATMMVAYPELLKIDYPENYQSFFLISRSITVIIPIFYIIYRNEGSFKQFGLPRIRLAKDFIWGVALFIISYILLSFFSAIIYAFMPKVVLSLDTESLNMLFTKPKTAIGMLMLLIGLLLNSFAEEFVMRGYFIQRFEKLLNSSAYAVIISSFIFALYHIYQPMIGVVSIFVFGVIYSCAYCKLRKVWPLAIAHSIHNLLIFSTL
ncbi:MAG: type II CAAX endopeptidase family protein [Leptolyngbyaceae cyanobacterium MO_188.B28]|nr:type II CAAX endopeptidase family protein [Leptolyngbyaceae cyanobacterium MO_188.B28]